MANQTHYCAYYSNSRKMPELVMCCGTTKQGKTEVNHSTGTNRKSWDRIYRSHLLASVVNSSDALELVSEGNTASSAPAAGTAAEIG